MDYDHRDIQPDEYSNREERPNAREKKTETLLVKKGTTNGETTYRPSRFRRRDVDRDV